MGVPGAEWHSTGRGWQRLAGTAPVYSAHLAASTKLLGHPEGTLGLPRCTEPSTPPAHHKHVQRGQNWISSCYIYGVKPVLSLSAGFDTPEN